MYTLLIGYNVMRSEKYIVVVPPRSEETGQSYHFPELPLCLCGQPPPLTPAFGILYFFLVCIVFHFPYCYTIDVKYKVF